MQQTILVKACPRCQGAVRIEQDTYGPVATCFHCAWTKDLSGYEAPREVTYDINHEAKMKRRTGTKGMDTGRIIMAKEIVTTPEMIHITVYRSESTWSVSNSLQPVQFRVTGQRWRRSGREKFLIQKVEALDWANAEGADAKRQGLKQTIVAVLQQRCPDWEIQPWGYQILDLGEAV